MSGQGKISEGNAFVYVKGPAPAARAPFLLKYDKDREEFLSHVPSGDARRRRLSEIVASCAGPGKPVCLLEYYDLLGDVRVLSGEEKAVAARGDYGRQLCVVCGGLNGPDVWSDYFRTLSRVAAAMEREYGFTGAVSLLDHSDVHYVSFAFSDRSDEGLAAAEAWDAWAGEGLKFLCGCGQFAGWGEFRKARPFAFGPDGNALPGMVFNDSTEEGMCRDTVSLGGGRWFRNYGYVGNTIFDRRNGRERPWTARPRRVDESACREMDPAGSVEEFALRRAAEGGLLPGDWFRLSEDVSPLWDGERWVDYVTEEPLPA